MSGHIRAPHDIVHGKKKRSMYVFLGGPIQGSADWRSGLPDLGEHVTYVNPVRTDMQGFEWDKQVTWEMEGLRISDVVLFWIPNEKEHVEGRDYAQTTRMELLECLTRGKRVVLGIDTNIHASRYMRRKAKDYGIEKVHSTLADCLDEVRSIVKEQSKQSGNFFYTSDTHFSQERTLRLSRRPFDNLKQMDWTMIERWNKKVPYDGIVYHLGDFGDKTKVRYLNGRVRLIMGNYEEKEAKEFGSEAAYKKHLLDLGFDKVYGRDVKFYDAANDLLLVHEPSHANIAGENKNLPMVLFGHIHGRQQIKRIGCDVGVDCNNYTPISLEDVNFFRTALDKYYDEEVFLGNEK